MRQAACEAMSKAMLEGDSDNEEKTEAIYKIGKGNMRKVKVWIDSSDAINKAKF